MSAANNEASAELNKNSETAFHDKDTGKISGAQVMFSVACYVQSSILYASTLNRYLKGDYWVLHIGAMLMALPLLTLFYVIAKKFPRKTLVEINDIVFGKVFGKIISLLYIILFVAIASINLSELSDFTQKFIMPKTSFQVISVIVMIVCFIAVYAGIQVITKASTIFSMAAIFVVLIALLFSTRFLESENLLPFFRQQPMGYVKGIAGATALHYGELLVFLMLTPKISMTRKRLKKKHLFGGMIIGGISLCVFMMINILVLGNLLPYFSFPTFEAMRIVSLSEAISRMEILLATSIFLLQFFRIAIILYAVVTAVSQIFNLKDYRRYTLLMAAFILFFMGGVIKPFLGDIDLNKNFSFIPWLIMLVLVPLIILLIAMTTKKGEPLLKKDISS